jgi:hypothetical protein
MPTAHCSGRHALTVALALAFAGLIAIAGALRVGPARAQDADGERFAGDAKCALCHDELSDAFPATPHGAIPGREHRCEDCHGPGGDHVGTAGNKGKIRSFRSAPPEEVTTTCLSCHREDASSHSRDFVGGAWEKMGMTCLSCHSVHGHARLGAGALAKPRDAATVTTDTCLVCHSDPVFNATFSHRVLAKEAPACASCHTGGATHVDAPGTRDRVSNPRSLPLAAERTLCLSCHRTQDRARHFPTEPEDMRCGDCHTLHRDATLLPRTPPPGMGAALDPFLAPERGRAFLRGRVRVGGRIVGGDEGRYDADIGLKSGVRLFLLEVEAGADDADRSAPRGSLRVSGLGDVHETARLEVQEGDAWRADAQYSRTELPFLGGGGVHPGEVLRTRWRTSGSVDAGDGVRVSAGHDALATEGDLHALVFDAGSVLPATIRRDRSGTDSWAAVDLRDTDWHFTLRQGWRAEDGDDLRRNRPVAGVGAGERLRYEDDSTLRGPVTSLVADADLTDSLSIGLRATFATQSREVDVEERRSGFVGAAPFTRTAFTDGDVDRDLSGVAVDVDWALDERWALEGSVERRAQREDGVLDAVETIVTTSGTTTTRSRVDGGYRQELRIASLGGRWAPRDGVHVRAGAEHLTDAIDERGADGTFRSRGLYGSVDADLDARHSVELSVRTTDGRGAFTPLGAADRDEAALKVRFRDPSGMRGSATWRRSHWTQRESDLGSEGDSAGATFGFGDAEGWNVDFAAGWNRLDLAVDRRAFPGSALAAGTSRSLVRSLTFDATVGVPLTPRLRAEAGASWVRDRGDLPMRALDGRLALRWELRERLALGVALRHRRYDASLHDRMDYEATLAEVWVETTF